MEDIEGIIVTMVPMRKGGRLKHEQYSAKIAVEETERRYGINPDTGRADYDIKKLKRKYVLNAYKGKDTQFWYGAEFDHLGEARAVFFHNLVKKLRRWNHRKDDEDTPWKRMYRDKPCKIMPR